MPRMSSSTFLTIPAPPARTADARPLIILATFGSGGDLEPFILMARALRSLGHRVHLLAPIDHHARLHDSGLPHETVGSAALIDSMLDDPELWDERRGLGVLARGLAGVLDETVDAFIRLAADTRCIAVCHPFMLPAAAIARAQLPALRVVGAWLAPSSMRSIHDPLTVGRQRIAPWVPLAWRRALWRFVDRHWIDNRMLPWLNAARARHGLPGVDHFFAHLGDCGDAALGLFPAWFARPAPDWPAPFLQADFPLPPIAASALAPELEAFLAAGEPPVVFTFGTAMRHAATTFEAGRRALAALGRRGVFVTRHAAQLPADLPCDILRVPHAPFASLLPRAAAIVHHGGIGTTAEALRAGIPQLAVASAFDQFDNGQRLRMLGVGDMLPAKRVDARSLRRRLARLLASETTAQACAVAATRLASDRGNVSFIGAVVTAIAAQTTA